MLKISEQIRAGDPPEKRDEILQLRAVRFSDINNDHMEDRGDDRT